VWIPIPVKERATTEKTHQIARMRTEMQLIRLQLNNRVFFGNSHSVHVGTKKLIMPWYVKDAICPGCDELKITDGNIIKDLSNHAATGKGNFKLQNCDCLAACGCGTGGIKLRASEVATRSSTEQALNQMVAQFGGEPLVLEGCDALKTTDGTTTSSQLKNLGGHIQRSGRPISHTKPADIAHQTPKRKEEVENKTIFRPS
jgi:hypothetical protein